MDRSSDHLSNSHFCFEQISFDGPPLAIDFITLEECQLCPSFLLSHSDLTEHYHVTHNVAQSYLNRLLKAEVKQGGPEKSDSFVKIEMEEVVNVVDVDDTPSSSHYLSHEPSPGMTSEDPMESRNNGQKTVQEKSKSKRKEPRKVKSRQTPIDNEDLVCRICHFKVRKNNRYNLRRHYKRVHLFTDEQAHYVVPIMMLTNKRTNKLLAELREPLKDILGIENFQAPMPKLLQFLCPFCHFFCWSKQSFEVHIQNCKSLTEVVAEDGIVHAKNSSKDLTSKDSSTQVDKPIKKKQLNSRSSIFTCRFCHVELRKNSLKKHMARKHAQYALKSGKSSLEEP